MQAGSARAACNSRHCPEVKLVALQKTRISLFATFAGALTRVGHGYARVGEQTLLNSVTLVVTLVVACTVLRSLFAELFVLKSTQTANQNNL